MDVKQSVEYDPQSGWVQVGDDSWLPRHFFVKRSLLTRRRVPDVVVGVHVQVVDPSLAAGVTLYEDRWSTPVARRVEVETIYGEVREKDLRAVRIVDMVEAGAAAVGKPAPDARDPGQRVQRDGRALWRAEAPAATARAIADVERSRRVLGRPRVDLAVVAGVYAAAKNEGRRDPTVAVAEHIGRARSTAAAYVSKAREARLLPPPA